MPSLDDQKRALRAELGGDPLADIAVGGDHAKIREEQRPLLLRLGDALGSAMGKTTRLDDFAPSHYFGNG